MPSSTSSSEGPAAKRALIGVIAMFLAINVAGIALWQTIPLSPVSTQRYLAAVDDHIAMLETSKGEQNRVILIGGSGVAFSISAQGLGETLGRPVYNGGIQAGIGFRNLVDLYADHLDPENDLIVLLPELELLAEDERYSQVWCDVVFLRKSIRDLASQPRCVPNILYATYQDVRRHLSGSNASDPVYRRSGFNGVGDLTSHLAIDNPAPDFSDYDPEFPSPAKLDRFETYVRANLIGRGFDVLYIPAATPDALCQAKPAELRAMIARLSALSTIDHAAHNLDRFCLSHDLFFDGAGHLNRNGRVTQTESIRAVLDDPDVVAEKGAN